jgi:hypothetical protein
MEVEAVRERERLRHEEEFKHAKRERDLDRARLEEEAAHQLRMAHLDHFRKQKARRSVKKYIVPQANILHVSPIQWRSTRISPLDDSLHAR